MGPRIDDLGHDILLHICTYLPLANVSRLALANKRLFETINSNKTWIVMDACRRILGIPHITNLAMLRSMLPYVENRDIYRRDIELYLGTIHELQSGHTDAFNDLCLFSNVVRSHWFHPYYTPSTCKFHPDEWIKGEGMDPANTDLIAWYLEHIDTEGNELISHAIALGDLELVHWLHERGITAGLHRDDLASAASNGNLSAVLFLHNTFPGIMDGEAVNTALIHAASRGYEEIVEYLDPFVIRSPHDITYKAIDFACNQGHEEMVRWLLNHGYDCSPAAVDGAVRNGHNTLAYMLMNMGIEGTMTPMDEHHRTTVDFAAGNGDLDQVKTLIHRGYKLTAWSMDLAAEGGHIHIMSWIHGSSRKEDWANPNGLRCSELASLLAAQQGHRHILNFLWNRGYLADPESESNNCNQCRSRLIEIAVRHGNYDTVTWLFEHGYTSTPDALNIAAKMGDVDMVRLLWSFGCTCTSAAMTNAASRGHIPVMNFLSTYYGLSQDLPTVIFEAVIGSRIEILEHLAKTHALLPWKWIKRFATFCRHFGIARFAQSMIEKNEKKAAASSSIMDRKRKRSPVVSSLTVHHLPMHLRLRRVPTLAAPRPSSPSPISPANLNVDGN